MSLNQYNPIQSMPKVLHTVSRKGTELTGTCLACNMSLEFNKNLRRWVSMDWNGHLCKAVR